MNPLEQRIKALEDYINLFKAGHSIPLEIDQAFKARLGGSLSVSTHSGETQAVNEGGVATYSVMATSNGFVETNVGGNIFYLPYYT